MTSHIRKTVAVAILSLALTSPVLAGSGHFIGVEGERVSGNASVSPTTVELASNFRTSKGPDLYVYLGNGGPSKIIGKLKKNSGFQTYTIPEGIDVSEYKNVYIHCKRFNHTFGKATVR